jgi:hypothetical protein
VAGSLVLNVEILGEFKKLADATKASQKSLGSLDDSAKKISKGINTALGAIGVGFSLAFLVNEFKDSTKAAIEDQKSKVLLTKALEDNLKASKAQVDEVERYINKTQIATSITDDKLRPAFSKLAIATKDTKEAMRLMSIATDVAAGTGKGLDAVVMAMTKSLAGSDTALTRLIPSVKGAADPMAFLEQTFKGAAEAAADTDPYARIQIILGELQEQIGTALLPILNEFSEWLATPEGQDKLQGIVDGVVDVIEELGKLADWIDSEVVPALEDLTGEKGFGAVATAVTNLVIGLGILKIALAVFSSGNPALAGILAGLALLAGAMYTVYRNTKQANDQLAEFQRLQNIERVTRNPSTPEQIAAETYQGILDVGKAKPLPKSTAPVPAKPGTINININRAQVNANDVAKALNDKLKSQGSSLRIQ